MDTNLIGLLLGLLLFHAAAWRWGVDSTDGANSPEWDRRGNWPGLGAGAS